MDNRDEIIQTQMDLISTLIDNNMRHIADDFWGDPKPKSPAPKAPGKPADAPKTPGKAPTPAAEAKPAEAHQAAEEETPPENIEDLKKELNELIGLKGVKREVNNLINTVTIYKLRRENGLKTVDMSLHMVFSGNPEIGRASCRERV